MKNTPLICLVVLFLLLIFLTTPVTRSWLPSTLQAWSYQASLVVGPPSTRLMVVHELHSLGQEEAKTTLPALIQALGDEEEFVRLQAASALGKLGTKAREAVPALSKLTHDPDSSVRSAALSSLGEMGEKGIDVLIQTLGDEDQPAHVRAEAAMILGRRSRGPKVVAALSEALTIRDEELVRYAQKALDEVQGQSQ